MNARRKCHVAGRASRNPSLRMAFEEAVARGDQFAAVNGDASVLEQHGREPPGCKLKASFFPWWRHRLAPLRHARMIAKGASFFGFTGASGARVLRLLAARRFPVSDGSGLSWCWCLFSFCTCVAPEKSARN